MPEIDSDLFQTITLGLLALLVLLVLGLMGAVSRVRKAVRNLEAGRPVSGDYPGDEFHEPEAAAEVDRAPVPVETEAAPASIAEAPVTTTDTWAASTPSAASTGAQDPWYDPAPETFEPSQADVASTYAAPQGGLVDDSSAGQAYGSSGQSDPQEVAAVTASEPQTSDSPAAGIPEEQPFERDGRWWFKRGEEILVYDEAGGQWTLAPDNPFSGGASAAPEPALTDFRPVQGDVEGGTAEEQQAEPVQAAGSFWKCVSCGAVNGSTATSCRMCFAARP